MPSYGNYQVDREIASGQGMVVYTARPPGQTGPASCAVKVFSPNLLTLLDEAAKEELDSIYAGLAKAALERIEIQKRAAAASPHVAPVLDHGQDGASVWYAAHLYPQSLDKVLGTRAQLNKAAIAHLLLGTVRGALAMKQTSGRSHGNLKPTNILLGGAAKVHTTTVVVADPLPGGAKEAEAFELADLRSVGELLFQLARRKAATADDWEGLLLPLDLSREWAALFGKDAALWLALCNQLLDRHPSLATLDLAKLEQELVRLTPKPVVSPVVLISVAAVLVLGGLALWWFTRPSRIGELVLDSDPPGAALWTNGVSAGPAPWRGKVFATNYTVVASNELGTLTNTLVVEATKSASHLFRFPYGSAIISSTPANANVLDRDGRIVGKTPLPLLRHRPEQAAYKLDLSGYVSTNVIFTIPADGSTNRLPAVVLAPIPEGKVSVVIDVEPPRLRKLVTITNLTESQVNNSAPASFYLSPGAHQFQILLPPPWTSRRFELAVDARPDQKTVQTFASGRLELDSTPSGASVWAGPNLVGVTPVSVVWPTGSFEFEWRLPNHATNHFATNLIEGATVARHEKLKEMFGSVRVLANLPGTRVFLANNPALNFEVGTNWTNIFLPPGTNLLAAEFTGPQIGALALLTNSVVAGVRFTNQTEFRFDFATVDIRVLPADATIGLAGQTFPGPALRRYVKPDQSIPGQLSKSYFDPIAFTVPPLAKQQNWTLTTNLTPTLYGIVLQVDPPQARLEDAAGPVPAGEVLRRTNGTYQFKASHPLLGSIVTNVTTADQTITQRLYLAHAKVSIRTPAPLKILLDHTDTGSNTPLVRFPIPPGSHTFTFTPIYPTPVQTNWTRVFADGDTVNEDLPYQFQPARIVATNGIELLRVDRAGGPIYVGRFEVTRQQYKALGLECPKLDLELLVTPKPNWPVTHVSWQAALDFCKLLTARDQENLKADFNDWVYDLPSLDQWREFAAPTTASVANGIWFAGSPAETNEQRKSDNPFGLFDVFGNAAEWCKADATGAKPVLAGGSYEDKAPATPDEAAKFWKDPAPDDITNSGDVIGFRILLRHK